MLRNVLCFIMRNQEGEVAELEGCLCHSFVRSPVPRSEEEGCVTRCSICLEGAFRSFES